MPKNDIENEVVGQTETPVEPIELEIQVTKASQNRPQRRWTR